MPELLSEPSISTLKRVFGKGVDYPLVFRELIQNADDCKAEWLALGFSDGIPDAEHPFLRGPALFAVNDGPLRPDDIEGICRLSMGTKVADAGSVGKFGLGLKSVFYFSELLFFADYRLDPSNERDFGQYGQGEYKHFDVLSPWLSPRGRKSRKEWEPFSTIDRERMGAALRDFGVADGFAIWAPLRLASHDLPGVIHDVYDETLADPSKKLIGRELLRVFPLLQHLKAISFKDARQPLVTIRREGASRHPLSNNSEPFEAVTKGELHHGQDGAYPYTFQEVLSSDVEFGELKSRSSWPKFPREDENTGNELQIPDPAIPHAGVVWQCFPSSSEPSLEAGLAVFLPLSVREAIQLRGSRSYRLTLHGYFFPTDDRRGIVEIDRGQEASGDIYTKAEWNAQLKERLIEPRILDGLPTIITEASQDDITDLTRALKQMFLRLRVKESNATLRHQWVAVWEKGLTRWQLISSGTAPLPIKAGFWPECWSAAERAASAAPLYNPALPNILAGKPRWNGSHTDSD